MSLKEKKKNNKLIYKFKFNKINKLFYNKLLINKLNNLNENIENIILLGNSGSGKTTIINILKIFTKISNKFSVLIQESQNIQFIFFLKLINFLISALFLFFLIIFKPRYLTIS